MAEIGIQVWQGVLPENDIPALQRHLNGRLVLMGRGFGAAIDRADAQPDEIRAYAADTLRRCCPGGHFIPSITYGVRARCSRISTPISMRRSTITTRGCICRR